MQKKFIKLIESSITRATRGGFLVGDYVVIVKNHKSRKEYKDLSDPMKEAIGNLAKSKLHLRITGINDVPAMRYSGNPDNMSGNVVLSVSEDQGGGRIYGNVLVPSCLCTVKDFYPNYAPFPDEWSYQNKEIHKPMEIKTIESGIKDINYNLPTKDTKMGTSDTKKVSIKIKKKKSVRKESFIQESYTARYLDGK